jgi:glycosyltransferase involved in cell wall biosynthesis
MKILHVTESTQGGIASFIEELTSAMSQEFPEIEIVIASCADQLQHLRAASEFASFPLPARNRSAYGIYRYVAGVRTLLAKSDAELIHAHSSVAGLAVRLAKLLSGDQRPVVYSPHGWSFAMETGAIQRAAFSAVERLLAPLAAWTVCQSENELRLALAAGVKGRLCAVPNGIRAEVVQARGIKKIDAPAAKLKVLFVGRFDRQKGFDVVLDAARLLIADDVHVLAVGGFVIDKGKIDPPGNVTIVGWVDRSGLADYFAWCDVVVMPSRWEAFGLVAIESMRAGKPVVVSDRGALPELVDHNETGVIFGRPDPILLSACLRSLEPSRLRRMGCHGREKFRTKYDSKLMSRSYVQLYAKALSGAICAQ